RRVPFPEPCMPESLEDKNPNLIDNQKSPQSRKGKERKKPSDPKPGEPGGGWPRKNILLILLMVAASLFLVNLLDSGNRAETKTYSEFRRLVADTSWTVTEVTMTRVAEGYAVEGLRRPTAEEAAASSGLGETAEPRLIPFKTMLPDVEAPVNDILTQLEARGIKVKFAQGTRWLPLLTGFLPVCLLMLFCWSTMARQSGQMGGPRGLFSLGKIKPRVPAENRPKVTFKDVAGCDEAKVELHEIIDFL